MMVVRMSLHQVPWIESDPVKKSTHRQQKAEYIAWETGTERSITLEEN